jgi:DNA-binding MurR/RpiR family transcriptional regulator
LFLPEQYGQLAVEGFREWNDGSTKALGYDGLPGLKRSLQGHLQTLLTPATGVSEYIATHLTRIGHRARVAGDTGYRLADRILLPGPEDACAGLRRG